jgi:hypothetical protein
MFQEEIANITAAHLRGHIGGYLDVLAARYGDSVALVVPKAIETDNLVGGVYNSSVGDMPAYAVDIIDKIFAGENPDGLWIYNYSGHIAGIVEAQGEVGANRLVKRHEQAVEQFVRDHLFMHLEDSQLSDPNDFNIHELGFTGAAFSGAEMIGKENDREHWIAGFRVDLLWIVSESGPGQHG